MIDGSRFVGGWLVTIKRWVEVRLWTRNNFVVTHFTAASIGNLRELQATMLYTFKVDSLGAVGLRGINASFTTQVIFGANVLLMSSDLRPAWNISRIILLIWYVILNVTLVNQIIIDTSQFRRNVSSWKVISFIRGSVERLWRWCFSLLIGSSWRRKVILVFYVILLLAYDLDAARNLWWFRISV